MENTGHLGTLNNTYKKRGIIFLLSLQCFHHKVFGKSSSPNKNLVTEMLRAKQKTHAWLFRYLFILQISFSVLLHVQLLQLWKRSGFQHHHITSRKILDGKSNQFNVLVCQKGYTRGQSGGSGSVCIYINSLFMCECFSPGPLSSFYLLKQRQTFWLIWCFVVERPKTENIKTG